LILRVYLFNGPRVVETAKTSAESKPNITKPEYTKPFILPGSGPSNFLTNK